MRPRAEHADLIASLRNYLASVDGDSAHEGVAPKRNTPGARSAIAAGGLRTESRRSRRDTLSEEEQAVSAQAERLVVLLVDTTVRGGRMSPGEESARRSGGRRADLTGGWAA
jgi:hypothetical protein